MRGWVVLDGMTGDPNLGQVNDVKSGANAKGAIGLWIGAGAVGHFRNLTVKPEPAKQ